MKEIEKNALKTLREDIYIAHQYSEFYGYLFVDLEKIIDYGVPVAAVSLGKGSFLFHINPENYLSYKKRANRLWFVFHEIAHLVHEHLFRIEGRDLKVWNYAADVVVNQTIPETFTETPEGIYTYKRLGLPQRLSTEQYYDLLYPKRNELPDINHGHSTWNKNVNISQDGSVETFRKKIKEIVGKIGIDNVPDTLKEAVLETINPPIPWQEIANSFVAKQMGSLKRNSWLIPYLIFGNKKQGKIKIPELHLGIVLDTSLSIQKEDFASFKGMLSDIYRVGNIEMTVLECDNRVRNRYTYDNQIEPEFHGRGGTSFSPAFEYILDPSNEINVDAVFYFTDGKGIAPVEEPLPTLWVIVGGASKPCDWGEIIKIKT